MWSGKTGLEKSQIKPEITHPYETERRKFTNEFKAEVALEAIKEKLTMVELAMKYKVNPVQIKAWKKEFIDNKASVFGSEGSSKTKREKEQLNKQEQELFEQIGRLKMENEWLKKKFYDDIRPA
jgi:transposase